MIALSGSGAETEVGVRATTPTLIVSLLADGLNPDPSTSTVWRSTRLALGVTVTLLRRTPDSPNSTTGPAGRSWLRPHAVGFGSSAIPLESRASRQSNTVTIGGQPLISMASAPVVMIWSWRLRR
jgi:hypothetical protein